MKRNVAVEPAAPMSAITVSLDIIEESGNNLISKNWRGEFIKLVPSCEKDGTTIYKVIDQSFDLSKLKGK